MATDVSPPTGSSAVARPASPHSARTNDSAAYFLVERAHALDLERIDA